MTKVISVISTHFGLGQFGRHMRTEVTKADVTDMSDGYNLGLYISAFSDTLKLQQC